MPPTIKPRGWRRHAIPTLAPRARNAILSIAALVSAAMLLAACGGSSNDASSNTSPPASGGGSGAAQPTADSTKAAKFAQCMRAHGVSDFPDPVNGRFQLKVTQGSDLDPNSPAFQSADQACKSLQPAGFGSNSTQSTGNQSKLLKFVSCMRRNGVPSMPDPQPNGTMLMSGGQINSNSPQFQQAMQACRSLLPAGAVGG
jgi:hypothetical protein